MSIQRCEDAVKVYRAFADGEVRICITAVIADVHLQYSVRECVHVGFDAGVSPFQIGVPRVEEIVQVLHLVMKYAKVVDCVGILPYILFSRSEI